LATSLPARPRALGYCVIKELVAPAPGSIRSAFVGVAGDLVDVRLSRLARGVEADQKVHYLALCILCAEAGCLEVIEEEARQTRHHIPPPPPARDLDDRVVQIRQAEPKDWVAHTTTLAQGRLAVPE
jgi:hypothetical protein